MNTTGVLSVETCSSQIEWYVGDWQCAEADVWGLGLVFLRVAIYSGKKTDPVKFLRDGKSGSCVGAVDWGLCHHRVSERLMRSTPAHPGVQIDKWILCFVFERVTIHLREEQSLQLRRVSSKWETWLWIGSRCKKRRIWDVLGLSSHRQGSQILLSVEVKHVRVCVSILMWHLTNLRLTSVDKSSRDTQPKMEFCYFYWANDY